MLEMDVQRFKMVLVFILIFVLKPEWLYLWEISEAHEYFIGRR